MKSIKYILLVIGVLGALASIYNTIVDADIIQNISSFIASTSLVYWSLNKWVIGQGKQCTDID